MNERSCVAEQHFRRIAANAGALLQAAPTPMGELAQGAMLTASRALGFLEALNLVAPDIARSVADDAGRLEEALSAASARLAAPRALRATRPW